MDVSEKSLYRLDPDLVKKNIDENTIGVFVIMGSTYTVRLARDYGTLLFQLTVSGPLRVSLKA